MLLPHDEKCDCVTSLFKLSLCHSPGHSSPSFYAGDEAGFFVFIPKDNLFLLFQFSIFF